MDGEEKIVADGFNIKTTTTADGDEITIVTQNEKVMVVESKVETVETFYETTDTKLVVIEVPAQQQEVTQIEMNVDRSEYETKTGNKNLEELNLDRVKDANNRSLLEDALKLKVSQLHERIQKNKKRENDLLVEIQDYDTKTSTEEQTIMQLHAKLQKLEMKLQAKEVACDKLKNQRFDAEVEMNGYKESWRREERFTSQQVLQCSKLRAECGDLLVESNSLKTKIKSTEEEIATMERKIRLEESACHRVMNRVQYLEHELKKVKSRISLLQEREVEIKETHSLQQQKLEQVKTQHLDADTSANILEMEAQKLEKIYDQLAEQIHAMSTNHKQLRTRLLHAQSMMADDVTNNNVSIFVSRAPSFYALPRLSDVARYRK